MATNQKYVVAWETCETARNRFEQTKRRHEDELAEAVLAYAEALRKMREARDRLENWE